MSRYIDADALEYDTEWSEYHDGFTAYSQMAIDTAPSIDLVRCAECRWSRPRTLKGENGYRCLFYRIDKAEDGYCDCGEREGE